MKSEIEKDLFSINEDRIAEVDRKLEKVTAFLSDKGIDAVLISAHENIAWATAGLADVRVGILRESGVASLLVTRKGGAYYLTTNNEAERLAKEEFTGLPFQPIVNPWYANDVRASVAKIIGNGEVAGDMGQQGYKLLPLQSLRYELTDNEVARYRWLGRHAAETTVGVLRQYQHGMSERLLQAMLAARLIEQGIMPSVYLTSVDARVLAFRHSVPRDGVLERLGMLGFCARRWGLTVAITRYVQFGAGAAEIDERFAAVAQVNARLLAATRKGITSDALFTVAAEAYAVLGYPGEERMHHQGGATGYFEREWVARPGGTEEVLSQQAFAWNPNIQGAKLEDTVLLRNGAVELLTATPELPTVTTSWGGAEYRSAGVLRN
ncbi:MAG TPA: M24 family metallopeptidase [Terracidiphilus sp.]|nr:M24 family metallopeptidase [Terracidiphilus sp.]